VKVAEDDGVDPSFCSKSKTLSRVVSMDSETEGTRFLNQESLRTIEETKR